MIVTTGLEPTKATCQHAEAFARQHQLRLIERRDASLGELRHKYQTDEILVVSAKGIRLEKSDAEPFFFHPNNAAFRIKRLERGNNDTMLSACQIQPGDHILDATLGLGADAIVFAHGTGAAGRVVGVESEPLIAMLVADGMKHWMTPSRSLKEAMERVEVRNGNHLEVLRQLPDSSFDVVYFDPMFATTIESSTGIQGIRQHANHLPLAMEAIEEALRVSRRRVVLKEGKGAELCKRFGFTPYRERQHQVFYSYREKSGGE